MGCAHLSLSSDIMHWGKQDQLGLTLMPTCKCQADADFPEWDSSPLQHLTADLFLPWISYRKTWWQKRFLYSLTIKSFSLCSLNDTAGSLNLDHIRWTYEVRGCPHKFDKIWGPSVAHFDTCGYMVNYLNYLILIWYSACTQRHILSLPEIKMYLPFIWYN